MHGREVRAGEPPTPRPLRRGRRSSRCAGALWFSASCLAAPHASGQTVDGRPSLRFEVEGALRCPSALEIRQVVADDFGYEFFASSTPGDVSSGATTLREAVIRMRRVGTSIEASMVLVDAAGTHEHYVTRNTLCRRALEDLLARFSVLMHARLSAGAAVGGPAAPQSLPTAAPPAPRREVDERERPPPVSTAPASARHPPAVAARWGVSLAGAVGATVFALPEPRPAAEVCLWATQGPWAVGIEGHGDLGMEIQSDEGGWSIDRWTGAVVGCRHWSTMGLCGLARGGVLSGERSGLARVDRGRVAVVDVGLRGIARLPLSARVALTLSAEAAMVVVGGAFVVRRADGGQDELWRTPTALLAVAAGTIVRIW